MTTYTIARAGAPQHLAAAVGRTEALDALRADGLNTWQAVTLLDHADGVVPRPPLADDYVIERHE